MVKYLKVNSFDNMKRTFLHYMCMLDGIEAAYKLYSKYRSHFNFNIELMDVQEHTVQVRYFKENSYLKYQRFQIN